MSYSNQQFWNGRRASKEIKGLNFLEVIQRPASITEQKSNHNVLGPNNSLLEEGCLMHYVYQYLGLYPLYVNSTPFFLKL